MTLQTSICILQPGLECAILKQKGAELKKKTPLKPKPPYSLRAVSLQIL